jgi:hypothetical protein
VPYRVSLRPEVSVLLGQAGLSRGGLVRVLTALHRELAARADEFRGDRHPEDETLFRYPVLVVDHERGGRWHHFDLIVDDTTAQGILLVVGLVHHSGPPPG